MYFRDITLPGLVPFLSCSAVTPAEEGSTDLPPHRTQETRSVRLCVAMVGNNIRVLNNDDNNDNAAAVANNTKI